MSGILERAAKPVGPRALTMASGATGPGVIRLAITTAGIAVKVPASLSGRFILLYTEGCNADFFFAGAASQTITTGQQSAVDGAGVITINAASGGRVFAGVVRTVYVPSTQTAPFLIAKSDATGSLVIEEAE